LCIIVGGGRACMFRRMKNGWQGNRSAVDG
jgi:hypothetical protein